MTFLFISWAITLTGLLWAYSALDRLEKLKKKYDLLLEAKTITSTPIKELAQEFRNFVNGIDGGISPEVEDAIKKLENTEIKKLEVPKNKDMRLMMTNPSLWPLFIRELRAITSTNQLEIIYSWGKKYVFTLSQQTAIIEYVLLMHQAKVRKYFDEYHQTNCL